MAAEKNILRGPSRTIVLPSDLSLGQLMLNRLEDSGDQIALINAETDQHVTFSAIRSKSLKLALYLRNQGLRKEDRIVICSENSLTYPIPVCAGLFLGVTNCPLNPGYSPREFLHALNISKAKYIFVSELVIDTMKEISKRLSWNPRIINMGKSLDGESLEDILSSIEEPKDFEVCTVNPEEHISAILCSSGTTGLPKGVMLTDRNFLSISTSLMELRLQDSTNQAEENIRHLAILPYYHAYMYVTMMNQLLMGVLVVQLSRFVPEVFLGAIERYRVTALLLVPPLLVFLAKSPIVDKYDLSSVKTVWCGAAPLPRNIESMVCKRLKVPKILQGYGLTESTLAVLGTSPLALDKPGTSGLLRPGVLAKVLPLDQSDTKEPLGPHQRGELCFKGDQIMKGYCGDTSSTAATIDDEGWLHTGDIGYYDEDGYFFIVDRLKELIKYKAFQVPPAELEAVLLSHPQIVDAAVVGLPDELCGELPLAFVVKQPGSEITASEVKKFVNGQVSTQKWLRGGVRFVKAIPKTASGKILRRELRDWTKSKL